jgi:hypothetical protein
MSTTPAVSGLIAGTATPVSKLLPSLVSRNRVHRLPEYVYFDHSIHIASIATATPTPNLRVAADVFDPAWQPPKDQDERGATLAHHNIDNAPLTDCSVCHR